MPESDCSTEFWEFVPYTIMLDYKSNTHANVMYPHFLERPMSIVVRALSRENQPPKSEVEGCSLLTLQATSHNFRDGSTREY